MKTDKERVEELLEDLMEAKEQIVRDLMIEMLLSFIVFQGMEDKLLEFRRSWMIEKFVI